MGRPSSPWNHSGDGPDERSLQCPCMLSLSVWRKRFYNWIWEICSETFTVINSVLGSYVPRFQSSKQWRDTLVFQSHSLLPYQLSQIHNSMFKYHIFALWMFFHRKGLLFIESSRNNVFDATAVPLAFGSTSRDELSAFFDKAHTLRSSLHFSFTPNDEVGYYAYYAQLAAKDLKEQKHPFIRPECRWIDVQNMYLNQEVVTVLRLNKHIVPGTTVWCY